jgi:hypothetical protein
LGVIDIGSLQTGWESFTVQVIDVGGSASNDDQFFLEIGIAGSSGTSGSSGSGSNGTSGSSGSSGTSGSSGSSGTRGTSGSSGSSGTSGSSGSSGTSGSSGSSGTRGTSGSSGSSGILSDVLSGYGYPIVYRPDGNYAYCENMYQYSGKGVVFNGQPVSVSGRTGLGLGVVMFYGTDYLLGGSTPIVQNNGEGRIQDMITSGTIDAGKLCYMTTTVGGAPYAETTRMAYAVADGPSTSTGLLAICLSASTGDDQIRPFALDGYVSVQSSYVNNKAGLGTNDNGKPIYMSPSAGLFDMNAPTTIGHVVRIVGHVITTNASFYTIYFRPDNSWIEL